MSPRPALLVSLATLLGVACGTSGRSGDDPGGNAAGRPAATAGMPSEAAPATAGGGSPEPLVASSTRPGPGTARPSPAARTVTGGVSLVYQRGDAVYRLPLSGGPAVRLFTARGAPSADRAGRYVAHVEAGRAVIRTLPAGRLVASVADADTVAFGTGTHALVAVRPVPPRFPHDCHRPTRLVEVDLRSGARRTVRELDDQFVPHTVVPGGVVGSVVPDEECEETAVALLDPASGRMRTFGERGELRDVSADGSRLWLHEYPDDAHPHGTERIAGLNGRTFARLPYQGPAAFGPGDHIVYVENVFGKPGTDEASFTTDTKVRTGNGVPSSGDKAVSLREADELTWSPNGASFVARTAVYDDPRTSWRAVECTVRLACRDIGLRWFDEVTLLAVVTG